MRFSAPVQTNRGAYPASCTMGTGSFPGKKRPGPGADHPPPSKCRGHERVGLYLYSPSGPSWPVMGTPLPLPYRQDYILMNEQRLNFSPKCGEVPTLYVMKAHVEIQTWLHAFLTFLLGKAERGGSRLCRSTPRERAPHTLRSWRGLTAGLDTLEKRSASLLRMQPKNFAWTVQPV